MGAKNTQFNIRSTWFSEYVSGKYVGYHAEQFTDATPSSSGHDASGGIVSQYEDGDNPGTFYKAHIFQNSGTFTVNAVGTAFGDTVDVLAIGGGGGGGNCNGGGGGAGGLSYRTDIPVSEAAYPVQVGRGGYGNRYERAGTADGAYGQPSYFGPSPTPVVSGPGGGAGANGLDPGAWNDGSTGATDGSAGGGATNAGEAGTAPGATASHPGSAPFASPPTSWLGNASGQGDPGGGTGPGGGGGGVVSGGSNATTAGSPNTGGGGNGITIPGPSMCGYEIKIGGGGSGGGPAPNAVTDNPVATAAGGGDGGAGASPSPGAPANIMNTGSGGGGGGAYQYSDGGDGAPGFVVVRYKINEPNNTAKATGGAISFYNSKTIHIFTHPGTFTTPGSFSETCEYVVIGGGGGSGYDDGGGGGAGAYREGTAPVGASQTIPVSIGDGGSNAYASQNRTGGPSIWGPGPTIPGTIESNGGGGGGTESPNPPATNAGGGGSGGGGGGGTPDGTAGTGSGDTYPGTRTDPVPSNGWGNDGSAGRDNTGPAPYSGGAGGGATGLGALVPQGNYGGSGIQLPATFQSPHLAPTSSTGNTTPGGLGTPGASGYQGPTMPGSFYVAGGGAGTRVVGPGTPSGDGQGGTGGGGWSGGSPVNPPSTANYGGGGMPGADGTGGGGGGGDYNNAPTYFGVGGGRGGSGLVAIAYPT